MTFQNIILPPSKSYHLLVSIFEFYVLYALNAYKLFMINNHLPRHSALMQVHSAPQQGMRCTKQFLSQGDPREAWSTTRNLQLLGTDIALA